MAVKQLKGTLADEFDDSDIEGVAENITELMEDVDSELDQITSEFDKDKNDVELKIKLHRVLERKGEREWLFDILPAELPIMDRVKEEYGGGKYQASVFKNGKLFRKFTFNIAVPRVNTIMKNSTTEINSVLSALAAQQAQQFSQLKELMVTAKPAPAFNMMEMMTGMVTLMVQMKNLMPQPIQHESNSMEYLLKGMEVMRELGSSASNNDKDTNLLDIVRDLIKSPLLGKALEGISAPVPSEKISTPTPGQSQLNPPEMSNNSTVQGNNNMNPIVKGYINQLIKKAAQNSDPELYAAFILDNVPETVVKQYLLRDDLMSIITAINPEASKYANWFAELKNSITQILTEQADENLTDNDNLADNGNDASATVKPDDHSAG